MKTIASRRLEIRAWRTQMCPMATPASGQAAHGNSGNQAIGRSPPKYAEIGRGMKSGKCIGPMIGPSPTKAATAISATAICGRPLRGATMKAVAIIDAPMQFRMSMRNRFIGSPPKPDNANSCRRNRYASRKISNPRFTTPRTMVARSTFLAICDSKRIAIDTPTSSRNSRAGTPPQNRVQP